MRKTMTKEVTTTTITLAKLEVVEGTPQITNLPEEKLLGGVTLEKAQKMATQKHGQGVTVMTVEPETVIYEMSVEEFMKHATLKQDAPEEQEQTV